MHFETYRNVSDLIGQLVKQGNMTEIFAINIILEGDRACQEFKRKTCQGIGRN
jgi:hypothetical protein